MSLLTNDDRRADESRIHEAMRDDVLLVRRLHKALRGIREVSAVLSILETTCPYCWDNDTDCFCEHEVCGLKGAEDRTPRQVGPLQP